MGIADIQASFIVSILRGQGRYFQAVLSYEVCCFLTKHNNMSSQFKHGLFGCFDNCGVCIIAWLAPCYVQGKHAEKVDESCVKCALAMFVPILHLITRIQIRGKIREKHDLVGSTFNDCLAIVCCPLCALVQEANQVDSLSMSRE